MSNFAAVVRWVCVLLVAVLVYVAAFLLFAWGWTQFGGSAASAYQSAVTFGTFAAVIGGTTVAPRPRWKVAAATLAALALIFPLVLFLRALSAGDLSLLNFIDVIGALAGCVMAYVVLRSAFSGRKINRVAGRKL
jgi:hypothetical protein